MISYLEQKDVNFADPDWAMDDEDVPFSSEFFAVRTLYQYYPDLREHLATVMLGPPQGI